MTPASLLRSAALGVGTAGLAVALYAGPDAVPGWNPFAAGRAAPLRLGQEVTLQGDGGGPWVVARLWAPVDGGCFVGLRRGDETAMVLPYEVRPAW